MSKGCPKPSLIKTGIEKKHGERQEGPDTDLKKMKAKVHSREENLYGRIICTSFVCKN